MDNEISVMEEKVSLKSELEDTEQAIENLSSLTRSLNKKLLHYEEKQADLAALDTAVLNAKVRELEDTVNAKIRIISLLENEAKLSQNEIYHSASAPSGTPARTPSQSGTPSQSRYYSAWHRFTSHACRQKL